LGGRAPALLAEAQARGRRLALGDVPVDPAIAGEISVRIEEGDTAGFKD
jgi:hypothetical protein